MSLFSSFNYIDTNNNIKITGNTILEKASLLDDSRCKDLKQIRIYLLTYQQLYNNHKGLLKDNSAALNKANDKISEKKCNDLTNNSFNFSITRKTTTSFGGGTSGGQGHGVIDDEFESSQEIELPAFFAATFYMNPEAKKEYLSSLSKETIGVYNKLLDNWNEKDKEALSSLDKISKKIKARDSKNYINWFFNSNPKSLEGIKKIQIDKLKQELRDNSIKIKN